MRCIFLFVILFSSFHLHAEIDKNLLVLVKYQDKNLNVEILQYPFFAGPSHQGPASYKITDKNTNKSLYIPINFTSSLIDLSNEFKWSEDKGMIYRTINNEDVFLSDPSPANDDGKNYDEKNNEYTYLEVGSWTFANNLVTLHQENNLSNVLTINETGEFNLSYIDNCEENAYYTEALGTEFTHEESDKCYYLAYEAPVSLLDIDFDGQNEILILIKHEAQRWFDKMLVFELDGTQHSSIHDVLDNYVTSINITKKLISWYATGGCCNNAYYIFKVIDGKLTLRYEDGVDESRPYLKKCIDNQDYFACDEYIIDYVNQEKIQ